jgi:transposase
MPVALSDDLRRRILAAIKQKKFTIGEIADRFEVGVATVGRIKRRFAETGSIAPKPHGGGPRPLISDEQESLVEALVQRHPDWSEAQYAETLAKEDGIHASAVTVGRAIRRLGYSVKKSPSSRASVTDRTSSSGADATSNESATPPLRVWFLWTKPARTRR